MTKQNNNVDNLNKINKICCEYKNNDNYCYTLCHDMSNKDDKSKKWLVIMSKLPETQIKDEMIISAKENSVVFMAKILRVIKIIDIYNPHESNTTQIMDKKRLKYEVNEVKKNAWIKCFSEIKWAYCFRNIPKNYTGVWLEIVYGIIEHNMALLFDRVTGSIKTNYNNGEKNGFCFLWDIHENKIRERNYKNGEQNGVDIKWNKKGIKIEETNYMGDRKNGISNIWRETGEKQFDQYFKNNKKHGTCIEWFENGKKLSEINYKKGRMHGEATYWYKNGQKHSEGMYTKNRKMAGWNYYYDNGKKRSEHDAQNEMKYHVKELPFYRMQRNLA